MLTCNRSPQNLWQYYQPHIHVWYDMHSWPKIYVQQMCIMSHMLIFMKTETPEKYKEINSYLSPQVFYIRQATDHPCDTWRFIQHDIKNKHVQSFGRRPRTVNVKNWRIIQIEWRVEPHFKSRINYSHARVNTHWPHTLFQIKQQLNIIKMRFNWKCKYSMVKYAQVQH